MNKTTQIPSYKGNMKTAITTIGLIAFLGFSAAAQTPTAGGAHRHLPILRLKPQDRIIKTRANM